VRAEHEYALLNGRNRSSIGRIIGGMASVVSGAVTFMVLKLNDIAQRLGWDHNVPPMVISLIGAATVYALLYWLFDKFAWKWKWVGLWLKVPNVSGSWQCVGQSLNQPDGVTTPWSGVIKIAQSWDRLRVTMQTSDSISCSINAALVHDDDGPVLIYNYANSPTITRSDLSAHMGFAQLNFSPDLNSASGEYFNGHGRFTYGTMELSRI
jgi:hypothetical protein